MKAAGTIVDGFLRELFACEGDALTIDAIEKRQAEFERVASASTRNTPRQEIASAVAVHLKKVAGGLRAAQWKL